MKLNSEYLWKDYKMIKQSRIYALLQEKTIEIVVLFYILLFLIVGLSMQPIDELVRGLSKIFTASGILISDYMVIGGVGPALVNTSIVGLIGYVLLLYNGVVLRGISIADRKSTRLNSSHVAISYAVFCLKKKKEHLDVAYDIS